MKKIFNYALLAAALLVGVNVNAGKVAKVAIEGGETTEYDNLIDAFNAVQDGETATITMLDDADFGTCRIIINNGKSITWDLAGKTVGTEAAAEYSGFVMNGGYFEMVNSSTTPATLNLKEKWGTNASSLTGDHAGYVIMIFGSKDDVANYSTFIMDGDIKYTALGEDNYAIKVEGNPANNQNAFGVTVDIKKGYVYGRYGALFVSGNIKATTGNRPVIKVEKDAELEADDQCTFLDGSLEGKGSKDLLAAAQYYARKMWSDENKWTEPEAKAWAQAYKESSAAIYGAGVAEWTINGYVHGGNGLYIKGGNVVLNGARVSATAAEYHEPILKSSGFLACGSAIILDTNAGYAGVDGITISNSIVTSDNGYAIEEVVTQAGAATGIPDIVVNSGTFVGGKGAITTTEDTRDKIKTENTITGGEWHNSDVTPYLDPSKNTVLEFTDSEGKYYQVVVPISKDNMASSIADAAVLEPTKRYAYIQENVSPEVVDVDRTIDFLLVDSAATVIVKSGVVLDAGTLMTEGSQIDGKGTGKVIVEAGGTLIISGEQGAYTYDANSLVIKSTIDEEKKIVSGQILINPAVVLNTTPKATVEFVGGSYSTGTEFVFDFFGAPFVAGSVTSFIASGTNYSTQLDVNRGGTTWDRIGTIVKDVYNLNLTKFDTPFGFYQLTSNNPSTALQTYTMQGKIFGNVNENVNFRNGWPGFSNAYMANADLGAFGDVLKDQNCDATIYTYTQTGPNTLTWDPNNIIDMDVTHLRPMQAFMLRNAGAAKKINTDYAAMVWEPAQTGHKAPRMMDMSKVSIRVEGANGVYDRVTIAQSEQFSAEYENGYDAEKYMNSEINLYVKGEKDLAIMASDNVEYTYIAFNCKNAGKYTMTFNKLQGESFVLVDTKTNAHIAMAEGTTYDFIANAGEDAYRFMIVRGAQAPTDMQKTNAAVKANKALINGQIVISNGERFFNVLGTEVK